MADPFSSAMGGFTGIIDAYDKASSAQLSQQQQQLKLLEGWNTVAKGFETDNPDKLGLAETIAKSFYKSQGIDDETAKGHIEAMKRAPQADLQRMREMALKYGVQGQLDVGTMMHTPIHELPGMLEALGKQTHISNEAAAIGGGPTPPTLNAAGVTPQAGVAPQFSIGGAAGSLNGAMQAPQASPGAASPMASTPIAAAPISTIQAPGPATAAPTATAENPPIPTADRTGPLPKPNGFVIPTSEGGSFKVPAELVGPAYKQAQQAKDLQAIADRIKGSADPNVKVKYPEYQKRADEAAAQATVTLSGANLNKIIPGMGNNTGAAISHNLVTGETKVIDKGQNIEAPLTSLQRAALNARGAKLDPNQAYSFNATTQEAKPLGVKQGEIEQLDPRSSLHQQQWGHLAGFLSGETSYQLDKGAGGKVEPISHAVTSQGERLKAQIGQDTTELNARRAEGEGAIEAQKRTSIMRNLYTQGGQSGMLAEPRIWVGQLADALGYKEGADKLNLPQSEALRSEFARQTLARNTDGKGNHLMPGNLNAMEDNIIQKAGPALANSPEGNKLMMDLADWGSKNQANLTDFANNWDAKYNGLRNKATEGEYAGLNYYQAKTRFLKEQGKEVNLPAPLRQRLDDLVGSQTRAESAIKGDLGKLTMDNMKDIDRHPYLLTEDDLKKVIERKKALMGASP